MSNDGTIRMVVGVDFTEQGDHALDEAIRYAVKIDNDELHPVFVITKQSKNKLDDLDRGLEEAQEKLREKVVKHCEAVGQKWEQQIVFHVRIGDPADVLHQVAVDVEADLIVVGTHGRKGLEKMLIGSVAQELVRKARVPVMVARPKELEDLEKTPQPEEARPGEDLHHQRVLSEALTFGKRPSHISGLV
ncbi:MAG TPA: universal stress protein [Sandaracinaceae bacterium LLY-WYZ-13_1]|nr:universal stress protein [Sandaracinaceae bacterium LLY-WYZ-13_1]